jgi:ATP-dependent Clp protease adapter protein ClpS
MSSDKTRKTPDITTDDAIEAGGMWQVILFNDNHNEAGYVVQCLKKVFHHCEPLAEKIMLEAHRRGKAIAEVEDHDKALLHKNQLQSCGLTAAVEPI